MSFGLPRQKIRLTILFLTLEKIWGEKEVNDFLDTLFHFEKTVATFPKSFRESVKFKGYRLGYVHRHITAIYKITKRSVTVLTVIANRSSVKK